MSLPLLNRLPDPWRKIVDWLVTLAAAVAFVASPEAEFVNGSVFMVDGGITSVI